MHTLLKKPILAFAFIAACATLRAEPPALKLKDNDVRVMAGDSITAQRQQSKNI